MSDQDAVLLLASIVWLVVGMILGRFWNWDGYDDD